MNFITETLKQITESKFLEDYLNYAIRFYLLKVARIFLYCENICTFLEEQPTNKLAIKIKEKDRQFADDIQSAYNSLQMYRGELKRI